MWKKYKSIDNWYNKKKTDLVKDIVNENMEWIALEKIDGSNASIFITDNDIQIASRNNLLTEENMFDYMYMFKTTYSEELVLLFNHLVERFSPIYYDTIEAVTVYGEVFGGIYTHPNIRKEQYAKKIQGRVQYCPQNKFRIFDIALTIKNKDIIKTQYLNYSELMCACNIFGLPYVCPLFVGSFEECMNYDVNFQTTIPTLYNLPEIENNFAEGVIIRPMVEHTFYNGNRIIFKKKSEKFNEKKQRQYIKPAIEYEPHIIDLMERVSQYITENRINNIISHFGTVLKKDFGKVLKTFNLDVFEAFEDEEDVILSSYTKEDQKIIRKYVNTECSLLMRAEFFKHTED